VPQAVDRVDQLCKSFNTQRFHGGLFR
jgi:hypothetical protein